MDESDHDVSASLAHGAPPHPGVRFPPPFLFVAGFLAGLALDRWLLPLPVLPANARPWLAVAAGLAMAAALATIAWSLATFAVARTAIIPNRPATRLVQSGPYRLSRNPMYVALSLLYVSLAALVNVAWPLVLWPAVVASLYWFVIRREERYLSGAFGAEYADYRRRVARWL